VFEPYLLLYIDGAKYEPRRYKEVNDCYNQFFLVIEIKTYFFFLASFRFAPKVFVLITDEPLDASIMSTDTLCETKQLYMLPECMCVAAKDQCPQQKPHKQKLKKRATNDCLDHRKIAKSVHDL